MTFRIEALKRVPSRRGGLSARLTSLREGAEKDKVQSLATRPYHVIDSGRGWNFDFDSDINPLNEKPMMCHLKHNHWPYLSVKKALSLSIPQPPSPHFQ